MILLDANVLSEWMRPRPSPVVLAWLDRQIGHGLRIPSIAKSEIEAGIAMLPDGKRKSSLAMSVQVIFDAFSERCLALDCAATRHYADIRAASKRLGRPVSVEDA